MQVAKVFPNITVSLNKNYFTNDFFKAIYIACVQNPVWEIDIEYKNVFILEP